MYATRTAFTLTEMYIIPLHFIYLYIPVIYQNQRQLSLLAKAISLRTESRLMNSKIFYKVQIAATCRIIREENKAPPSSRRCLFFFRVYIAALAHNTHTQHGEY